MVKRVGGQKGFTLMEIIVVLAVIAALAAVLVPVVFRYIDDAKKAQAQGDASVIAAAISQLYKDTGKWPFCADCGGAGKSSHQGIADATYLTSNGSCDGSSNLVTCDTTKPELGSGWTDAKADSLANHLITNTPFATADATKKYSTSSPRAWKGAYLDRIPALDPWGRSYVVNIVNANPAAEGPSNMKWTVVLSGGPNGTIETARDTLATGNPSVGGDDVIARVK